AGPAFADATRYRMPPPAIEAALNAPPIPTVEVGPRHRYLAILTPLRYPPVADLARPMLRLAGLRIDPVTNGIHHARAFTSLAFARIDPSPGSGQRTVRVALPADAHLTDLRFSPDETRFAITNATAHGTELWLGTLADGRASRVANVAVNGVFDEAVRWAPDGVHLFVRAVDRRGPAPAETIASGPAVQETSGKAGQIVTYEDMLANAHDEALFEYYATSRVELVDARTGAVTRTAARGIFTALSPSPDGRYVLTERVHRPFSYLFPYRRFPRVSEVLDLGGRHVATIADRPLEDRVPANGVPIGPRDVAWKPSSPATLAWTEALDGGDPRAKSALRDRIVTLSAPFGGPPREVARTPARTLSFLWLRADERALINTFDRDTGIRTELLADARAASDAPKTVFTLRDRDVYNDPGSAEVEFARNGDLVVAHDGDAIWLRGAGYGRDGRRPFLDRLNLRSGEKTRLFVSQLTPLEQPIVMLDPDATRIVTTRQSPAEPPNVYVRTRANGALRAVTAFTDPAPQLRAIGRRVVSYKRADGVDLSFTLYTPPGWKEGTRLPTFVWAYPLEYIDPDTASQNTNTTQTFVSVTGASPLFLALAGYAVLDNASMPIVGSPATVNDTFVDQLVADAKAAVDKAVEI
ncbi:MAG TPA: hypothetical protein VK669_01610, partial [Candidatus Limnocylindrales bacterium]|nr:hypothetical protein [Candidatus Limnocylindrales bacterium]